jgi:hypothetical protein
MRNFSKIKKLLHFSNAGECLVNKNQTFLLLSDISWDMAPNSLPIYSWPSKMAKYG